ncbi:ribosomal protein S18-alanine N-acetyltransferase [Fodinisporobacter ferrooxydans]|uniref:Ribosomal protein S18-alanine N-acetyltransferase n=1 Tax=Fodinisporobacter ferrooxydans TaxID=2901836 RepID=A0ABY4CP78_9BACL|nr:ribosomal protein S18-alanine N-acetyltransferase [Alicyclobacillaceae bacterium MYW30-H2]
MNIPVTFRKMKFEDIDQILEIEREAFLTPWTRAAFEGELKDNHFAQYYVAVAGQKVAGYCGMWVILDEAHITNIAIRANYRGKKIGEALLRFMMAMGGVHGAKRITLEVRVSNSVARQLYYKLGFEDSGIRKGYYTDNNEDALIMWADLPSDINTAAEERNTDRYAGS